MNLILKIILTFFLTLEVFARESGETEITTEDGIEVFQNEKFYLLKKNVKIESDAFNLNADDVKINFNQNLYDITEINAKGNVNFYSDEYNLRGKGEKLKFEVPIEKLKLVGLNSELFTDNIQMFSDGFIEVDNLKGDFSLNGNNSKLRNENIFIKANAINGVFLNGVNAMQITLLRVSDEKISYVKNNDTEMYAKKINFDNDISIIELIDNVTIIRNGEKITGDYGTLDTKNNSYKIKSKDQTKVKAIIQDNE